MAIAMLEAEVKEIFRWISDNTGGNLECRLEESKWIVQYTSLALETSGLIYDQRQDLLGLILVDDGKTHLQELLAKAAYVAERSKSVILGLDRLPPDWHLFIISDNGNANLGSALARSAQYPRSMPYGISLLQPREDEVASFMSELKEYRRFLETPGDQLPQSIQFFKIVRFFAPLLPYTRRHLRDCENLLGNVEQRIVDEWRTKVNQDLQKKAPSWPDKKKQSILDTILPKDIATNDLESAGRRLRRLERLEVDAFKALHLEDAIRFGKRTFITGGNGAGKTSLIEAIELGLTGTIGRFDDVKDATVAARNLAKTNILAASGQPVAGKLVFSVEDPGDEVRLVEHSVDLGAPSDPTFKESFVRFSATQAAAAKTLNEAAKDRYSSVLGLMGVKTDRLNQRLKATQRRLNDALKADWDKMGLSPNLLRAGSTSAVERFYGRIRSELGRQGAWPRLLSNVGSELDNLCSQTLSLVDEVAVHGATEIGTVETLLDRLARARSDMDDVGSRFRLWDRSVATDLANAIAALRDAQTRMTSLHASPQLVKSPVDTAAPDDADPATILKTIQYLDRLQAYGTLLEAHRPALDRVLLEAKAVSLDFTDSISALLQQAGGDAARIRKRLSSLQAALETAQDRLNAVTPSLSVSALARARRALERKLQTQSIDPGAVFSPAIKEKESEKKTASLILSVSETVSHLTNTEIRAEQMETTEGLNALCNLIERAQVEWDNTLKGWTKATNLVDRLETVSRMLSAHASDRDENSPFTLALISDLLGSAGKSLDETQQQVISEIATRTWFAGWLEFNGLLSASRWSQPLSFMSIRKDALRLGMHAEHQPDENIPLPLILNQGELSVSGLAWVLLGYLLHGRRDSDVLIIDDPFFALDPAHQRYAIEALLRAIGIINPDCQVVLSVALQDEVAEFLARYRPHPRQAKLISTIVEDVPDTTIVYCNKDSAETCKITPMDMRLPEPYKWQTLVCDQSRRTAAHDHKGDAVPKQI